MKHLLTIVLLFSMLPFAANAQIASIRVDHDSGSEVKSGTIVKLEAAVEVPASTQVLYRWKLHNPPSGYKIEDFVEADGKRVYFATGILGSYKFDLVIVSVVNSKINLQWVEHTIQVIGVGVPPTNPPTNPPTDPPVDPPPVTPTSFGLVPIVTSLGNAVNDTDRVATAQSLAMSYISVATQISAGTVTTSDQAKSAVVAANRKVLSAQQRELWRSFAIGLSEQLNTLEKAGKFKTLEDYRLVFLEIANGLSGVK